MIVFGLGNPGSKYCHTRHNAGFDAVEKAAAFFQVSLKKRCFRLYRYAKVGTSVLVEPLTYMNNSGKIVKYLRKYVSDPHQVAVVCDNMDLAVGGLRVRSGGGSSGQKGLNSIARAIGSSDFLRIYIGIGRPEEGVSVVDHVLGIETNPEKKQAYEQALEDASRAIAKFLDGADVQELQSEFNRKGLL